MPAELIRILIGLVAVALSVGLIGLVMVWVERKVAGHVQRRPGNLARRAFAVGERHHLVGVAMDHQRRRRHPGKRQRRQGGEAHGLGQRAGHPVGQPVEGAGKQRAQQRPGLRVVERPPHQGRIADGPRRRLVRLPPPEQGEERQEAGTRISQPSQPSRFST